MKNIARDPRVLTWAAERRADGWKRDRIVAASKAGTDGWPLPDGSLSNGSYSIIAAVLDAAKGEPLEPPKAPRRRSGKRIREIREAQKAAEAAGQSSKLLRMQMDLQKATNVLELTDVEQVLGEATGFAASDAMRRLHEDLTEHQIWVDFVFEHVRARMDDAAKLEVIRRLREDTAGRTEQEQATAERLAEKLERKLHARLMQRQNGSH